MSLFKRLVLGLFVLTLPLFFVDTAINAAVVNQLEYGFWWVDAANNKVKAYDEKTGTVLSVTTTYFNPAKPTVLYFHGWQKDSCTRNYARESFQWTNTKLGINQNTVAAWKNAGWNVAIFYWNQFADESEVKDAEAKIWSATGPRAMRYRLSDGTYSTTLSPTKCVTDLAYDQYVAMIKNGTGIVRFAGHSLGNQLAVNLAKKVSDLQQGGGIAANLMPERIELLDPFWSKDKKSYLNNNWTGERVRWYIQEMKDDHGIAVTWYKTSGISSLGVGDTNTPLEPMVAVVQVKFDYLSGTDQATKHVYAVPYYFLSFSFTPPVECISSGGKNVATGNDGASASTPTSRIKQMMGKTYRWEQVVGNKTWTPDDDWYLRKAF